MGTMSYLNSSALGKWTHTAYLKTNGSLSVFKVTDQPARAGLLIKFSPLVVQQPRKWKFERF